VSLSDEELEAFLLETDEGLAALEIAFMVLERDPADPDALSRAFRVMHTIKGTSGFFEFKKIEVLAHAGEDLLAEVREGNVALDGQRITLLLAMVDGLRVMIAAVRQHGTDRDSESEAVIQALTLARGSAPGDQRPGVEAQAYEIPVRTVASVFSKDGGGARAIARATASTSAPAETPVLSAPAASVGQAKSPSAVVETHVRVDVARLDGLMNMVGELVLIRNQIAQQVSEAKVPSPEVLQHLNGVTAQLQEGVLKVRMQPVGSLWSSLPRVVRDLAASLGKQVDLVLEGADTELDRAVIDSVRDPLVHSVRNAIDHGLELPETRVRGGKPPRGRLHLRAWHETGFVRIAIADDGAGINLDRVRRKAVERGLLAESRAHLATDQELVDLLFLPGFSTADAVTNISGRGVGMDVVRAAIEGAGGRVQLTTRNGAGTTLMLSIPLTLAIISGLIVRLGNARYVIPRSSLNEVTNVERSEDFHGVPLLRLRNALIPLVDLGAFLAGRCDPTASLSGAAVIVRGDGRCFGLLVDEVLDLQEIVVKPLPRWFREPSVYAGLTILGDGSVAVILDIAGVGRRARVKPEDPDREAGATSMAVPDVKAGPALSGAGQVIVVGDGRGGRRALRLSDVVRIEEFEPVAVERLDGRATVQYRGFALPLFDLRTAGALTGASGEPLKVVVAATDGRRLGIVVDDILDIADASPCDGTTAEGRAVVMVNGSLAALQDLRTLMDASGKDDGSLARPNATSRTGLST
jgi:two-component system, chemotaxis family, sensor kinase CheA